MAKTTRSSTAAKVQKGKASAKALDARTKSKAVASKGQAVKSSKAPTKTTRVAAKPAPKAAAKKPVGKPAARKAPQKPVVKKAAAAKPLPKKVAKPVKPAAKKAAAKPAVVKKPVPGKIVAKKVAPPKAPVGKTAARAPARPVPAPAVKKAAAPTKTMTKAVVKSASKPAAVEPVKQASPPPATTLYKGKVASATAMVTPRAAPAAAHHDSSHKNQKNLSSSMNKLAVKKLDNGITREDGRYALPSTSSIPLPKGYHPSSNEEYMNPQHLAYFRNKLRDWRDQLVEESRQTMDNLRDEVRDVGDEAERATRETENSLELRTRDRYRKLISKIDKALRRIEEGSYGFCEETDEEIGVDRLDARPIATLSLDAQERREHLQKQMGD